MHLCDSCTAGSLCEAPKAGSGAVSDYVASPKLNRHLILLNLIRLTSIGGLPFSEKKRYMEVGERRGRDWEERKEEKLQLGCKVSK